MGEQAARTGVMSARRLATAREGLGIRSEREIQREINRTIAQYSRLKRSGTLTSRELARASEQARNRVRELNAEMGKTPMGQRVGGVMSGVAGVVGGLVTAKHIITPAMNDRKQWDANVTNVAIQAFGDKSEEYIKTDGIKQIQQAVLNTVKNVGGTHDQVLGNLNAMMVNGMSFEQAHSMLGQAQKMQVSGEASSEDIGSLIKVLSDYGFKGDELITAFQHALRSGMDGKFEIKDMVNALPSLLATASNAGFKGMKDFDYLLAWLQSAADKSGSNSEAANNVANTLNKATSSDTIARLAKTENPFLKGKGIDLEKSLLEGKTKGKNPIEVLSEIADGLLTKDAKYQQLQQQLKVVKTDSDKQQIEAQMSLMKGFVLSQLLPDVQAKNGLNAATDKKAMDERLTNTSNANLTQGLNDKRFNLISGTDLAAQQRADSLDFLGESVSGSLTKIERDFNDWKIKMAKENPELFSTISSVTTAFGAVAGGAAAAAVALWGLSGRRGGGLLPDIGGQGGQTGKGSGQAGGRSAAGSVRAGGGRLGSLLRIGSKALGAVGVVDMAMVLGEQQPYQQAQREIAEEKRREGLKKFGQAYAKKNKATGMGFAYGDFSVGKTSSLMGKTSQGVPLYGGYALAHLSQDDKVAKARYEMGNYSQAEYEARVQRNEQERQQYITPSKAGGVTQEVGSGGNIANSVANSIAQSSVMLGELLGQSGVLKGEIGAVNGVLAQYQADFAAFGQTISDGLQAGLAAQSHTIDNRLVVELDGRVVAENVSQYFFNMANRG